MNDPRVEAARIRARLWMVSAMHASREQVIRDEVFCAYEVIQAADAADREQGIHRVRVDDATVERVARTLFIDAYYKMPREAQEHMSFDRWWEWLFTEGEREMYRRTARAVLAALTGAEK